MRIHVVAVVALLTVSVVGSVALAESDEGWKHGKRGMSGMPAGSFGDTEGMVEKMSEHLDLDDLQRQNVQNIMDAAKPEMEAMRDRKQAVREKKQTLESVDEASRSALLSEIAVEEGQLLTESIMLRDRVHTDVSAVLNDEQRAKLDEHRDHRQERMSRHGRDHSNGRDYETTDDEV
jgi:Spy/CpxP family protein refolding chaperone